MKQGIYLNQGARQRGDRRCTNARRTRRLQPQPRGGRPGRFGRRHPRELLRRETLPQGLTLFPLLEVGILVGGRRRNAFRCRTHRDRRRTLHGPGPEPLECDGPCNVIVTSGGPGYLPPAARPPNTSAPASGPTTIRGNFIGLGPGRHHAYWLGALIRQSDGMTRKAGTAPRPKGPAGVVDLGGMSLPKRTTSLVAEASIDLTSASRNADSGK